MRTIHLSISIPEQPGGRRLDQVLADLVPEFSRSRLQQWIRDGQVTLDSRIPKPREHVHGGESVRIDAALDETDSCLPEAIPLDIVYEDAALLVINKPAGLVMHPAAGNPAGTLQNALLHHDPALAGLPRAGIVHRLDKETSGLLVVARSPGAHCRLVAALQARTVTREYLAVVNGTLSAGGRIDAPIGRHPVDRTRMAVVSGGRPAVTHYRVVERYRAHTLVRVTLETGRTHQIRVHMAHRHSPVTGDPVYGARTHPPRGVSAALREVLHGFRRQALHARRLALAHPDDGRPMAWEAPVPDDMARLITALQSDAAGLEETADGNG